MKLPDPQPGDIMGVLCEGGVRFNGTLLLIVPNGFVALERVHNQNPDDIVYVPWEKIVALSFRPHN